MSPACRFGDFVLDRATRELSRGGERIALPAKAFDCIVYLLEHRARAVGRDELIAAVWGRADVSDSVLSQTVLHARRALDDTGREQQVIRTVVGFGYHWVAAVEPADAAVVPLPAAHEPAVDARPVRRAPAWLRTHWRVLAAGAMALGVAAVVGIRFAHDPPEPRVARPAPASMDALIVLPLEVSGEHAAPWMRLGIMDLVAERLRDAGQAVVPSEHALQVARAFDTDDARELDALASAASVARVLEPGARWSGRAWRVQLAVRSGSDAGFVANGRSGNLLDAARAAADDMARHLGLRPPAAPRAGAGEQTLRERLQQIEAATLEDRLEEARALIDGAPPAQRDLPEMRLRSAKIDVQAGRLETAQATLAELADRVGADEDRVLRARILVALGSIATRLGHAEAALADLGEAISLLQGAGAGLRLGKAHAERASARIALHRDDAALADFAAARVALEAAGDSVSLAYLDSNLGAFAMLRDRYAEAVPVFERAARRFALLRIPSAELNARDALVQAQLILLRPAAAARSATPMEALAARVANPEMRRAAGLTRVEALLANGSLAAARELLDATLVAAPESADSVTRGRGDAIRARLRFAAGDLSGAARAARAAEEALTRGDDQRLRVRNWLVLVRALAEDRERARAAAERIAVAANGDDGAARLYATLAGALASAVEDPARAQAAFERALDLADAGQVPLDLLEVARSYAPWLLARNDTGAAGAVVERVSAWSGQDYDAALLQVRLYHALGRRDAWQAALQRARALAGERRVPAELAVAP